MKQPNGWDRRRAVHPSKRKCARIGCSNVFVLRPHGPVKYCSYNCRISAYRTAHGAQPMGPRDKLRVFKCKHGHERTPENTAYRVNGQGKIVRSCRVCDREWQSEHYDRRRRPCGKCGGIKDVRGPGTRLCSACRPPVYIAPVRECPHCGSEFIPPPNNRRKTYCTKACGQAHRKELHAAGNQV